MIRDWIFKEKKELLLRLTALTGVFVTLTLFCLFFIDQPFARYFGDPSRTHIWLFHREITEIGAAEPYIALALFGLFFHRYRKKASYLLACLLSAGVVVHIFKFIFGRARPHKFPDHDPFHFDFFNFHHHFQSLPSGHSQTLFTVATYLCFLFPKWTWAIFSVTFYLAMTRAFTLAHFVSDVLAGALTGIVVTILTQKYLIKKYGT